MQRQQETGKKCTKNTCKNGGQCFIDVRTEKHICVCPKFTSGSHCQYAHVFTRCSGEGADTYCREGGTCLFNDLTGQRLCAYNKDFVDAKFDFRTGDVESGVTKDSDAGERDAYRNRVYNLTAILIGIGAVFGVMVIAALIFHRRHQKQSKCKKERKRHDSETDSICSHCRSDSLGSTHKGGHTAVNIDPQEPFMSSNSSIQEPSKQPSFHASREENLQVPQHTQIYRSLPVGYVGSFDDISKRSRLSAVRDETATNTLPRYSKSVGAKLNRINDDLDMNKTDDQVRNITTSQKSLLSNEKKRFVRARAPTISDVPVHTSSESAVYKQQASNALPKIASVESL